MSAYATGLFNGRYYSTENNMGLGMYISKITISNFKCFSGRFELELGKGLNILVGDNETGKSTIIEAIHLALTGLFNGRHFRLEFNQGMFNAKAVKEYLESSKKTNVGGDLPEIEIEIFMDGFEDESLCALFRGNANSEDREAAGIKFWCKFGEQHKEYYETLIKETSDLHPTSVPIECYDFGWQTFARDDNIGSRMIPIRSDLINSARQHSVNGSDLYILKIIRNRLNNTEKTGIASAHRKMRDNFRGHASICNINDGLKEILNQYSKKDVRVDVGFSRYNDWDTTLTTYMDDIPFQFVGMGEQIMTKTKIALESYGQSSRDVNVVLVEEPENHLSHANLSRLISEIATVEKQIIMSTHSTFVANKLGLDSIVMLNREHSVTFKGSGFDVSTIDFFKKLPGYETLRLVLSDKAILVEGPSDELILQKMYKDKYGKLPIQSGVEVISVGTSATRFLEIADKLKKRVAFVTDNDGNPEAVKERFKDYRGNELIKVFYDHQISDEQYDGLDDKINYNTLEPAILRINDLKHMNAVLGTKYRQKGELLKYMLNNKTNCALKIFDDESDPPINLPDYMTRSIKFIRNE